MGEQPGRIDLPCPACREVVPLWIKRADVELDAYRGGLLADVRATGAHACAPVEKRGF